MKAKVSLSYTVELFVEGEDEEQIYDWLLSHTPDEAAKEAHKNGNYVYQDYSEAIICQIPDDGKVDVRIND